jgi:aerobic-type carbon monoxide dehydrogenase small subunit (CoxS/CutS family)
MPANEPMRTVTVTVNGVAHAREVEHRLTLADFLRHTLGLTGTHVGCEHGVCGACTVLVDGIAMRSCLMLAAQAAGKEITTVEGLSPKEGLSRLQSALWERHGLQCGFCTPGILASLTEHLEKSRPCSEDAIRDVLSGHLCRCTGYQNIVAAVLDVVRERAAP